MTNAQGIWLKSVRLRNVTFVQYSRTGKNAHNRPEPKFNKKPFSEVETALTNDGFEITDVEPRRAYFTKGDITYRVDV